MKASEIINQACEHQGVSKAELANRVGIFPSSLYRKLANESMTLNELQKYLQAIGVTARVELVYDDGTAYDSTENHAQLLNHLEIMKKEMDLKENALQLQRKAFKDLRTDLNSAVGYLELGQKNEKKTSECLAKLKNVHSSMGRTIAYALGEGFGEEEEIVDDSSIEALEGKRVLVVDDNKINQEIISDLLEEYGLMVETSDNGEEAIDKVIKNDPGYFNFIIMDIEMPGIDGYDTTTRIRKMPNRIRANVPIIALSANANPDDRRKAALVGMDAFLAKPVDSHVLLSGLAKLQ